MASSTASLLMCLEELKKLKNELIVLREDVLLKIANGDGPETMPVESVKIWLSDVLIKVAEVDQLINYVVESMSTYVNSFGEMLAKMQSELVALKSRVPLPSNNFDLVVTSSLPVVQIEMPIIPLELPNWDEIWERLKLKRLNGNTDELDNDTGVILGLYGKKGVGKTICLMKINNTFLGVFDCVIWVEAMNLDCYKLQDAIASRTGLSNESGWGDRNFFDRACIIYNSLKSKEFVLLLDNLFTCVDLNQIGIPYPNVTNKSRIVFTTTNIEVYHEMDATSKMEIQPLEAEKAWELFKRRIAMVYNDEIGKLAREVADLCGGVPRTLITVARAMARMDSPQAWTEHLAVLKRCQSRLRGTEIQPLDPVDESKEYFDAIMQHRNKFDFYSLGASSSNAQNLKLGGTVHGFQNITEGQQIENSPSGLAKLRAQVEELEEKLESTTKELRDAFVVSEKETSKCKSLVEELSLKAQFQVNTIQELMDAFAVSKEESSKCKAQVEELEEKLESTKELRDAFVVSEKETSKCKSLVEELSLKAQFQESTIQELKDAFAVSKEETSKCKAQLSFSKMASG